MILRKLSVRGWRKFAAAVELGELRDGLNVVHGPNASGKSTLMWAVVRAFCDSHGSKSEDIKLLRPWGRELDPAVSIEFEHEGASYRLRKQFLSGAAASIERRERGVWTPLHEGRAADAFARDLLQLDEKRGAANAPRDFGLAQLLWAPQGQMAVGEIGAAPRSLLQQALGVMPASSETAAVVEKARAAYERYFTRTGNLRSGEHAPTVVALEKQREEALARRASAQQRLDEYESAVRQIEDLQAQLTQQKHAATEWEQRQQIAVARAREYENLLNLRQSHERDAQTAKATFDKWEGQLGTIRRLRAQLQQLDSQRAACAGALPALQQAAELAAQRAAAAVAACDALNKQQDALLAAQQEARQAVRLLQLRRELADLEPGQEKVRGWLDERQRIARLRAQIVAPDAKQLAAIRAALRAMEDLELKRAAALITLEVIPEREIDATALDGEARDAAGGARVWQGSPQVRIRVAGVGEIIARGPGEAAAELHAQWLAAKANADKLTEPYGTQSLAQLEQHCHEAQSYDASLRELDEKARATLAGRTFDERESQAEQCRSQISDILAKFPGWSAAPPDAEALQFAADRAQANHREAVNLAATEREAAEKSASTARDQWRTRSGEADSLAAQRDAAQRQLDELLRDGLTDEQREARRQDAAIAHAAAQGGMKAAQEKLDSLGSDPRPEAQRLTADLQKQQAAASEAAVALAKQQARLETLVQASPYTTLAQEEERIAELSADIQRQRAHLAAVKLLHLTLEKCHKQLTESVLGPIQRAATRTLQRIAGPQALERLLIGDDYQLREVAPRDIAAPVSVTQLSGGEQEQAQFALRLALAEHALPAGRHLLVLDDVFTFTDSGRLARIAGILEEAAQQFQIVLLTCHPERYRTIASAAFFSMEELGRSQKNWNNP